MVSPPLCLSTSTLVSIPELFSILSFPYLPSALRRCSASHHDLLSEPQRVSQSLWWLRIVKLPAAALMIVPSGGDQPKRRRRKKNIQLAFFYWTWAFVEYVVEFVYKGNIIIKLELKNVCLIEIDLYICFVVPNGWRIWIGSTGTNWIFCVRVWAWVCVWVWVFGACALRCFCCSGFDCSSAPRPANTLQLASCTPLHPQTARWWIQSICPNYSFHRNTSNLTKT